MTSVSHIKRPSWWLSGEAVGCPACMAKPNEPCRKTSGDPMKGIHAKRREYADFLNAKATGTDPNARWWRHQLRHGKVPMPRQPHGTEGAFLRHKRNGEEPCAECMAAMRELWTERNQARAAKRAAAKAEQLAKREAANAKRRAAAAAKRSSKATA